MRTVVFTLVTLFLVSCGPSLRFYTKDIHDESRWSENELHKIQFYLSNDIILFRQINHGESVITDGKIKMVNGQEVEEVVIRRGTKGEYLFSPQKKHYAIGFDPNNDKKFLIFGPSENVNDRYVLLAKDWDRNYGKVTYGDKIYKTSNESAFAFLMVDVAKTKLTKVRSTQASGRKVD